MQLSLMIEGQEGVSWEQWVALARACESHGIGTLFRSDHYANLDGSHPDRGALDAWGTICALAAVTSTVRLGTLVSPATFRHPSELAKLVTTADRISNGRIELGLGAGWNEREHAAYGFELPPMRERIDLLSEQLAVVHSTWTSSASEPFSFDGARYTLRDLVAVPPNVQQPHPPLLMGGSAAPRVASLAARYADEYNTVYASPDDVRERKARIDDACAAAAGREPIPFSVMTLVVVGADAAERADRTARWEARTGGSLRSEPPPNAIVATIDDAAEQLAALGAAGASRVMCQHLLPDDLEMVALLGERLAPLLA